VLGIAKALRDAGYELIFVPNLSQDRPDDRGPDEHYRYQGFRYIPAPNMAATGGAKLQRLWQTHLTGRTVMDRIRGLDLPSLRAVIVYHGCAALLWTLQRFCRGRRAALLADCTEWYDPWHVPGGPLSPFRWDCELRMRWLQKRLDGVIAISSYLQNYYESAGVRTLRVPPLVDLQERKWDGLPAAPAAPGELRLVYGGTPGRKDLIGNAIRAIPRLRTEGVPVHLTLLGPSPAVVRPMLAAGTPRSTDVWEGLQCLGRIPQHEVPSRLATADFSILLRPQQRFAQAGFPTKVVESLAAGVPVLTNRTSDIACFVKDGQEGLHLRDETGAAFCEGVHRIWRMPHEHWQTMRTAARDCAAQAFDYRRYVARLSDFAQDAVDSVTRRE
jgi:glycosyltransferase involved in cell wall biosynthesis